VFCPWQPRDAQTIDGIEPIVPILIVSIQVPANLLYFATHNPMKCTPRNTDYDHQAAEFIAASREPINNSSNDNHQTQHAAQRTSCIRRSRQIIHYQKQPDYLNEDRLFIQNE
jgi:hypothetical protein